MAIKITIHNLITNVDVGIYPHEIGSPQPVQFTIDVNINPHLIDIDEISSTVDYDILQALVIKTATAKHYNLLENLCYVMVQTMIEIPNVLNARVEARKLNIPKQCEAIIVEVQGEPKAL